MTGPFAPRLWGVHLLGVLALVATGALGYWQLESWQARRAAEATDLSSVDPLPLADVIGPDDPFPGDRIGQPVEVSGAWVPSGTIYVSGREHDGRDGFWMVTPMTISGGDSALPIVLGWVDDPASAPPAPTGDATLTAYLQPGEGTGQVDDDPSDDVLPQLRIADVIQHVDQDLYGGYAVSVDGVDALPAADLAALPDVGAFTALRNLLYALEWWVFGGFAAFIWWRYVRDQLAESRKPTDLSDPTDPGDPVAPVDPVTPVGAEVVQEPVQPLGR